MKALGAIAAVPAMLTKKPAEKPVKDLDIDYMGKVPTFKGVPVFPDNGIRMPPLPPAQLMIRMRAEYSRLKFVPSMVILSALDFKTLTTYVRELSERFGRDVETEEMGPQQTLFRKAVVGWSPAQPQGTAMFKSATHIQGVVLYRTGSD